MKRGEKCKEKAGEVNQIKTSICFYTTTIVNIY